MLICQLVLVKNEISTEAATETPVLNEKKHSDSAWEVWNQTHIRLMLSVQKHINTLNMHFCSILIYNAECVCVCFELPAESQLFCHISPTHLQVSSKLNWNTCSIQQHLWSTYTLWTQHIPPQMSQKWQGKSREMEGRREMQLLPRRWL